MKLIKQLQRLDRMHYLIKLQATGTPREFSRKLNVSESTLFEYLQALKELGAKIAYSRIYQSYSYREQFIFQIGLSSSESFQVKGGVSFNSSLRENRSKLFYHCSQLKESK